MTVFRASVPLVACLPLAGCLSVGARVQASPTLSTRGQLGAEVLVGVHVGFAAGARQTAVAGAAGRSSTSSAAGLEAHAEYHRIGERWSGWAGIGSEIAGTDATRALIGFAAVARNLRYQDRSGCDDDKGWGWCSTRTRALAFGLELRAAYVVPDRAESAGRYGELAFGPVIDWTMIAAAR